MPNINNGVLDGVRRIGGRFRDIVVDGGLPGAPLGFRMRGATASGPPVAGTWKAGDQVPDRTGITWTCVAGGTPGTWAQSGVRTPPLMSVTAAQGGSTHTNMSMTLRVLTGAATAQPGATGGSTAFTSPQVVTVTPQATGSVVYGALYGFTGTFAVNAATFVYQNQVSPGELAQFRSAALTTASTPVTLGRAASDTGNGISIVAAEILAAAGASIAEDPSSPVPTVYTSVGTALTTAQFQPPAGSLLVLTISAAGSKLAGSGVTTMSIADTSGLGLTWKQVAATNTATVGYTGVWVAQVPAVSSLSIPVVDDRMPATLADFESSAPGSYPGLLGLWEAIANRDNANCSIVVIGDSITEGQGATAFLSRYASQAAKALRQRYPTLAGGSSGGYGFIPMASTGENTFTWPVVSASGSPGIKDIGPVRKAATLGGAGTFTFTAPAGSTSVNVMYYNDNSGSQFSYRVDAGAVTTVTASGTVQDGTLTASISLTSGQVLTVAWVSGTVYLEGIVHYAGDENSGITVHGCGQFGITTAGWIATEASGINWAQSFASLNPAALAVYLGTNDNGASISPPQTQANLLALITYVQAVTALANVPWIIMVPQALTASEAQWVRGVLPFVAGSRAVLCDVNYRLPGAAQASNLYNGAPHMSNEGNALLGEILAARIKIV